MVEHELKAKALATIHQKPVYIPIISVTVSKSGAGKSTIATNIAELK